MMSQLSEREAALHAMRCRTAWVVIARRYWLIDAGIYLVMDLFFCMVYARVITKGTCTQARAHTNVPATEGITVLRFCSSRTPQLLMERTQEARRSSQKATSNETLEKVP